MAKGYWVALADVSDPEGYKEYVAENAKAFRKYGARFLTRGGKIEPQEGKLRSRCVVIEFPSFCCRSRMLPLARICEGDVASQRPLHHGSGGRRRL